MQYLRQREVVHRDLKPGNIMKCVSAGGAPLYKLIDFGAARVLPSGDEFMSVHGTPEYLVRASLSIPLSLSLSLSQSFFCSCSLSLSLSSFSLSLFSYTTLIFRLLSIILLLYP